MMSVSIDWPAEICVRCNLVSTVMFVRILSLLSILRKAVVWGLLSKRMPNFQLSALTRMLSSNTHTHTHTAFVQEHANLK